MKQLLFKKMLNNGERNKKIKKVSDRKISEEKGVEK
jgi:hypothetical protein